MILGIDYFFHETKCTPRRLIRMLIFHNGEILCSNVNWNIFSRGWGDDSVGNMPDTKALRPEFTSSWKILLQCWVSAIPGMLRGYELDPGHWPANIIEVIRSRYCERPCLKIWDAQWLKKTLYTDLWHTHTDLFIYTTCSHTYTPPHIFIYSLAEVNIGMQMSL